ncbi:hypothetical protein [Lentzea sp. NPDC055074]
MISSPVRLGRVPGAVIDTGTGFTTAQAMTRSVVEGRRPST